jgi:hypothetical protein
MRLCKCRVAVGIAVALVQVATASAQVSMTINAAQNVQAISPYIYGTNDPGIVPNATFARLGGNRWTAYNWTNNDSNAGSDYYFQNDNNLSSSTTPGAAVLPTLQADGTKGAATLLTIPINGYVSADRNGGGDVRFNNNTYVPATNGWTDGTPNPNYLSQRFVRSFPNAAANVNNVPNAVYQDQFVNWVNSNAPNQTIFYDMDNEPDIWGNNAATTAPPNQQGTHQEVHPGFASYSELEQDNVNYAKAVKAVAPNAMIFGGVNYGWQGYINLQGAAQDNNIKDTILNFQASYLKAMKAAEVANNGQRLIDVLDMHWYPEAQGTNGVRITGGNDNDAATVAARLQAARSLWDSSYVENSWITSSSLPFQPSGTPTALKNNAIQLLNREQAIINEYYPGTKIGISEYEYGGGNNISGGVAEADVLGVFGQKGVFAASWWDDGATRLNQQNQTVQSDPYITSAFNMYLNYDGHGHKFGNTEIGSSVSDASLASVYASEDAGNPNRMVIVLINKSTSSAQTAAISFANIGQLTLADAYQLVDTGNNATAPIAHANLLSGSPLTWTGANSLNYLMPAESVTTLVLVKPQLGDLNLDGVVNLADLQTMLSVLKNESSYETAHNLTPVNLAALGDFNGDGVVNAADLSGMEQYLTSGTIGTDSTSTVPEPATIVLGGIGLMMLSAAARRKVSRQQKSDSV